MVVRIEMAYNTAMPLDPEVRDLLQAVARSGGADLSALPVARIRELARRVRVPADPTVHVERRSVPGPAGDLPVTLYRPPQQRALGGGLVFFPGGGFVIGSELAGHDALCRALAQRAQCSVVSVEYRLAPEQRFPAAVDDAYAAVCYVHEYADTFGIDHARLAVGGYTAGANLATTVARLAKERRNPPLRLQLLVQPMTDLRSFSTDSYHTYGDGYGLTRATLMHLASLYVTSDADRADPRCSPQCAQNLIGLPPAFIVTAEFDPLRDEAEAYAAALQAAHVEVTLRRYEGMVHGFVHLHAHLQGGRRALEECAAALRAAF